MYSHDIPRQILCTGDLLKRTLSCAGTEILQTSDGGCGISTTRKPIKNIPSRKTHVPSDVSKRHPLWTGWSSTVTPMLKTIDDVLQCLAIQARTMRIDTTGQWVSGSSAPSLFISGKTGSIPGGSLVVACIGASHIPNRGIQPSLSLLYAYFSEGHERQVVTVSIFDKYSNELITTGTFEITRTTPTLVSIRPTHTHVGCQVESVADFIAFDVKVQHAVSHETHTPHK